MFSRRNHGQMAAVAALFAFVGARAVLGALPAATTEPLLPPVVPADARVTLAILGDNAPVDSTSAVHLATAVRELNLLRPAAVFTVGGLIPGLTRSTQRYAEEAATFREAIVPLTMPWYPCVGRTEVLSGTRDPADATFETLYKKTFGPLYYSVDVGAVHVIVLDSEEGRGEGSSVSEMQLAWLKGDLNRIFVENSGGVMHPSGKRGPVIRWLVVLLHRPLWRIAEKGGSGGATGSNWERVHRLLVDFNRRPIVSVEGASVSDGPRVVGVWAGAEREYSKEATRDGIRYTVLGATAAHVADPVNAVRHLTLLTFDAVDGAVHPALIALGSPQSQQQAVLPDDVVTERERQVLDAIAALPSSALGVEGAIELPPAPPTTEPASSQPTTTTAAVPPATTPPAPPSPLTMTIANPLDVPLDLQVRLANGGEGGPGETHWEMDLPHQIRHLAPGAKEEWPAIFTWRGRPTEVVPPVVEFVVHWADPRGGSGAGQEREIVLRRRIPVVTETVVPVAKEVSLTTETGWEDAVGGRLYNWRAAAPPAEAEVGEMQERAPEWEMVADAEHVFVRIRVEDGVKSYSANMALDPRWGGLASDAVGLAWAPIGKNGGGQWMWIMPFGPKGPELWESTEAPPGTSLTRPTGAENLQRMPAAKAAAVRMDLATRAEGYTLTVAVPRAWLEAAKDPSAGASVIRWLVEVDNNDETAWTRGTSNSPPAASDHWAKLRLSVSSPTTAPAQKDNK